MRAILLAVIGSLIAAPAAAVTIYAQVTASPTDGHVTLSGAFDDSTAYPSSVLAKRFRVVVDNGTLDELAWNFFVEPQALWWEHDSPEDEYRLNGNEYGMTTSCDVYASDICTVDEGEVALIGNVGRIDQTASPTGFNRCAADKIALIAANFVGVSGNCAETYVAHHSFDAFVTSDTAVTLTVTGVPEPETWGLLATGFGVVGYAMRRVRRARPAAA